MVQRWTKLDTHALVDFIRSTEQSGDNRHSLPESVQFATRKNKPGHVTPRSNDVPPRKPFSSFLCLFFVSRIFFVPSLFFPHLNTPFKDPRGKKLYFVYTRHERYYKRENVFLCGEFYGVPFFCIIEHAEEIEIENLKNLYYKKKKSYFTRRNEENSSFRRISSSSDIYGK